MSKIVIEINDTEFIGELLDAQHHLSAYYSSMGLLNFQTMSTAMLAEVHFGRCDTMTVMLGGDVVKIGKRSDG